MISGFTIAFVLVTIGFFGLLAYTLGKRLYQVDTELVKRRRAAAQVAAMWTEAGMPKMADLCLDYSVGDYIGIGEHFKSLAELAKQGPEALFSEFKLVRERAVDAMLRTPEGRALLAAKLSDRSEESDPSISKSFTATAIKAAATTAATTAAAALVPMAAPLVALAG